MSVEQDPYSLIKYINVMNINCDHFGYPTIHVFVEMGLLNTNEKLTCTINNKLYECYIDKNEKDQYVLCYKNKIKETNVMKFIHKLSKLIKIKIQNMGEPFARIHRISDNQSLLMIFYDLIDKFEQRIKDMLIGSEFDIWQIYTSRDNDDKKLKFICKSNMKYDDILKIISNNEINHNDIDNDMYKEKQQLYNLLKHNAIEIIYQPITDDDIFKLERGDDICYGSGIYKNGVDLEGSISFFVKDANDGYHYALTAKHVINNLYEYSSEVKCNINSFNNLSIDFNNIIKLDDDIALFRIKGIPYCKIVNLDCTALSGDVYKEFLSSSESASESSSESASESSSESASGSSSESSFKPSIEFSSLDDSNSEESKKKSDEASRNPINVSVVSLKSLLDRHKPNKVPIFKHGVQTNLTVGFIKTINTDVILDNTYYKNIIEIEWIDNIEFATNGDSGCLYFVYDLTTNTFVPVAMHVGSKTKRKRSYGVLLSYIFQELVKKQYRFLICNSIDCQEM